MYVTARKLSEENGESNGEARPLGLMDDINSTPVRQQVYDALFGDSEYGGASL